jgi:hypothetical protein
MKEFEDRLLVAENFQAQMAPIFRLLTNIWWSRCWVYQELIVARAALLCWPGYQIDSKDFFKLAHVVQVMTSLLADDVAFRRRFHWSFKPDWPSLFDLQKLLKGNAPFKMAKLRQQWQISNTENSAMPLRPLLAISRSLRATDGRDRVYAFLGLSPHYHIVPNYSADFTEGECFREATLAIIKQDKNLDVVCDGMGNAHKLTSLPSWVPDFSSKITRRYRWRHTIRPPPCAGGLGIEPEMETQIDNRRLRIRAIKLGQLDEASIQGPTVFPDKIFQDFKRTGFGQEPYSDRGELIIDAIHEIIQLCQYHEDEKRSMWTHSASWKPVTAFENGEPIEEPALPLFVVQDPGQQRGAKLMGRAPLDSKGGDSIFIAPGSSVPWVLRRINEAGAHNLNTDDYTPGVEAYRLVGDAYVHGFMHGRAIQGLVRGTLMAEWIDLY